MSLSGGMKDPHASDKKEIYAFGRFQVQCRLLNVMSDQIETDPSRQKIDQQITEERNTLDTDTVYSTISQPAYIDAIMNTYPYVCKY